MMMSDSSGWHLASGLDLALRLGGAVLCGVLIPVMLGILCARLNPVQKKPVYDWSEEDEHELGDMGEEG
jgi:hypothetical protein